MSKIDTLDPEFRKIVDRVLADVQTATGLTWVGVSARRTIAEQNKLYQQGRTTAGNVVTNAKGGQSPHNFGLAVDLAPMKGDDIWWNAPEGFWEALGAMAENNGLRWGGRFKSIMDRPHIEASNWKAAQLAWSRGELEVA